MDSGNSGSMQSSSGGDEESYDSRAESISAFLTSSSLVGGSISTTTTTTTHQPPPPHLHHHHSSSSFLFDSLSNYMDPFSRPTPPLPNPSSLLNLDMVLPGSSLRSEPNFSPHLIPSPSSSSQPIMSGHPSHSGRVTLQTQSASIPLPTDQQQQPNQQQQQPGRNPKKRSRASRRAPTTVLTTDTSNFRAMVQEFTGIPAPPFSASTFPRTRLDLFNTSSTVRSGSHLLDHPSPPSYLLRPFAQKLNPPPFLSSSSFSSSSSSIIDHVIASSSTTTNPNPNHTTTNNNNNTTTGLSTSTSNNYQLLTDQLGFPKQSSHNQNLLNMQNPSLIPYHSLLQSSSSSTPPKYPPLSITSVDSRLKMGVLEEFTMNNDNNVRNHLGGSGGLPNLVTSDNPSSNLGIGGSSNDGDQDLLRSFNGNYSNSSQQRVINNNGCKLNYSGSSSDFNAEKGTENNVSSRGEGMVDSWICSSD
ncbi:VQ [Macleaya cordata]|uniref:VQ n=1 Tax=Macleaya cordata TaxID=56857 RepID=A0A200QUN3_MACCD|nr:VQ [Macleaya cordata]